MCSSLVRLTTATHGIDGCSLGNAGAGSPDVDADRRSLRPPSRSGVGGRLTPPNGVHTACRRGSCSDAGVDRITLTSGRRGFRLASSRQAVRPQPTVLLCPAACSSPRALPYANGPIHVGHLVEYLQTDIWVRFQKLRGNRCVYVCADDTHGTAIMISAKKAGVSEEEFIARVSEEHQRDFADFRIEFDNYGSTNSEENRQLCARLWSSIRDAGLVKQEDVEQLYDPEAETFLADRFVRGTCPECGATDQPGDNCSSCGTAYTPVDLIDPKSTLSGATPELRSAPHLFIELERLHGFLREWVDTAGALQGEIANYLKGHFLGSGDKPLELRDWDVSSARRRTSVSRSPTHRATTGTSGSTPRSATSPAPSNGATSKRPEETASGFEDWWASSDCEVHHFIGKDITYFHTLFWPGMLQDGGALAADEGAHPRLPDGRRREDVQEQGDARRRADLLESPRPVVPALLLRVETLQPGRRLRSLARRVHREDQHGFGRQGGEPRQPQREVRAEDGALVGVPRRRRPLRRGRRRRSRDRRRLTSGPTTAKRCG